ncbi:MAG: hypothetical protein HY744_15270 [Deltaproteobacteria bacterium]|nr:hypothetical protein [Deltaproteobacteria bacterium]
MPRARGARGKRRTRLGLALASAAVLVTGLAATAAAAPSDKEAGALFESALYEDYLNTDFPKAIEKLQKAIELCGKDKCGKKTMVKLYVGQGTVLAEAKKPGPAKEAFAKALEVDPDAKLLDDFKSEAATKLFEEAKKIAGGAPPEKPTVPEKPTPPEKPGPPAKPEAPVGGEMAYEPPEEALVNTPLSIFIRVAEELGATKVKLRYKPFGGTKWLAAAMKKMEGGFGGVIPCADLTTTGKVRFYIVLTDEEGDPVATAGSLDNPFSVAIKNELEGEQPTLPGEKPPKTCVAKEDCPPGFPGCGPAKGTEQRGEKGWGDSCEKTEECKAGFICLNGSCEQGEEAAGPGAPAGPAAPGALHKNWVNLTGQFDIMNLDSAKGVCGSAKKGSTDVETLDNYFCFDDSGEFLGVPLERPDNEVQGGLGFASFRLMAGYERVIWQGLVAGAKLGFAIGGYPGSDVEKKGKQLDPRTISFIPVHAEAQASYYFLPRPFERPYRPYAFIDGGFAHMSAGVDVRAWDQVDEDGKLCSKDGDCSDKTNQRDKRDLTAYQVSGMGFVGFGPGIMYVFHERIAVKAEVKLMFLLPTFGFSVSPTVAPVFMF